MNNASFCSLRFTDEDGADRVGEGVGRLDGGAGAGRGGRS